MHPRIQLHSSEIDIQCTKTPFLGYSKALGLWKNILDVRFQTIPALDNGTWYVTTKSDRTEEDTGRIACTT